MEQKFEQHKLNNKERVKKYILANPEKWKNIQIKWRANNPDYIKNYNLKKKQQKLQMEEKLKNYENFLIRIKEGFDNGVITVNNIK